MSWKADAKNAGWLLGDRLVRFLGGAVIGIVVARHLGPDDYGRLNFAQAWVGMFSGVAWLGVGDSVVRDLVQRPEAGATILGTSWRLRLAGSTLAMFLALTLFMLVRTDGREGIAMVMVLGLSVVILEPASAAVLWFQANRQLKPVGISRTVGYSVHQGARVIAVASGMGLLAIAAGALVEAVVTVALLLLAYSKSAAPRLVGTWNAVEAARIVRQGFPIMIGALLGTLFLRIDQVILGQIGGNRELGIYAAAVRISEIWWALPALIMQAVAPRLFYAQAVDELTLRQRLTMSSSVLLYSALAAATITTVFAESIVPVLLGSRFVESTSVLVIHSWTAIFVFIDAPAYQYLIARNLHRFIVWRSALALIANATAATVLAPEYGAPGVAVGALIAYLMGNTITYAFSRETRVIVACQLRGITRLASVFATRAGQRSK
jgi:polysaccharide transporter, PST family